ARRGCVGGRGGRGGGRGGCCRRRFRHVEGSRFFRRGRRLGGRRRSGPATAGEEEQRDRQEVLGFHGAEVTRARRPLRRAWRSCYFGPPPETTDSHLVALA